MRFLLNYSWKQGEGKERKSHWDDTWGNEYAPQRWECVWTRMWSILQHHSGWYITNIHNNNNTTKWNFSWIPDDNKVKAGNLGAIEMILGAMKTYPSNTAICKQGCGALCNITVDGTSQTYTNINTTQLNEISLELQLPVMRGQKEQEPLRWYLAHWGIISTMLIYVNKGAEHLRTLQRDVRYKHT